MFKSLTKECTMERFVVNCVSSLRRPVTCFTGSHFGFAAYRKNFIWAVWDFWRQYLLWPLGKLLPFWKSSTPVLKHVNGFESDEYFN